MSKYVVAGEIPEDIKQALKSFDELTQALLYRRDIVTEEDAQAFLHINYEEAIHDPFLMHGMEKAVSRILEAIKKEEKIIIYSDYDCDGIPGGVILHDFFKKIKYENFENYIPHRHTEGYGLNNDAIKSLHEDGANLIITVDCGITDVEPVDLANKLGMDVIITDHHLQNGDLPKAYAILNPNQDADETYPFTGLCGAGVAFKLVQGLIERGDFVIVAGWDKWLLDMAGLSTIADMVPLTDENRAIAKCGLHVLRKSRRPGLQQLLRKIKVDQRFVTEDDVGFMIGPRINAASRMDHPMDAFHLLATNDVVKGGELAKYLDKLNNERKGIVASMTREVNSRIRELDTVKDVIVMGNPDWRPALLGLVANSIMEEHKRPVFLWGREGGSLYKGSCRSDGSVNLVELMGTTPDTFVDSGGHAFAGGFSVKGEHIHNFENILNDAFKKLPKNGVEEEVILDKKMNLSDVTFDSYKTIEMFAPFGEANPKPQFLFEDLTLQKVEHFGKEKNHLRLHFLDENTRPVSAISFFKTKDSFDKDLREGALIHLVATFEKSFFLGKTELRLRIVDIF